MYIFLLNIRVMPKFPFQIKVNTVLVAEILEWFKVTVKQMEWENWPCQHNMSKKID